MTDRVAVFWLLHRSKVPTLMHFGPSLNIEKPFRIYSSIGFPLNTCYDKIRPGFQNVETLGPLLVRTDNNHSRRVPQWGSFGATQGTLTRIPYVRNQKTKNHIQ